MDQNNSDGRQRFGQAARLWDCKLSAVIERDSTVRDCWFDNSRRHA